MSGSPSASQIVVLDAGGQYCHLIARKVRELGVSAEVRPSHTPAGDLAAARGLILSGGPASVYAAGSPSVDPDVFSLGVPVLGICYGHQLMAHLLGGRVQAGEHGEFGLAELEILAASALSAGLDPARRQVWMSHRDLVSVLPPGFAVLARTDTCPVAAMGDAARRLYGLQFHPEVAHTLQGRQILSNFVFHVCGCRPDWDPRRRVPALLEEIRAAARGRHVFFFVSGGVDSSVAYTLCLRALGAARVRGIYVDTGLMREGETEFVRHMFDGYAPGTIRVEDAAGRFLRPLIRVRDPEEKRRLIGEQFVQVQEEILEEERFLEGDWILGQGTIYPDTIESGGTAHAALIKTHHNRVPGIQRLLESGRVLEPLRSFYKDEVRQIGRELGLPEELIERQPFPGPGLAVRCLCADAAAPPEALEDGWLLPVRSVGVQGDSRSYQPILALAGRPVPGAGLHEAATRLANRTRGINRVVAFLDGVAPLERLGVRPAALDPGRLARLRQADALVRRLSHESGFDRSIWQFPVILIPLGTAEQPDSVVLRPVDSVDGMTARSLEMDAALLDRMTAALLGVPGVGAVLYDLTHKPPATIEWE